jgi:hypothetical protein
MLKSRALRGTLNRLQKTVVLSRSGWQLTSYNLFENAKAAE